METFSAHWQPTESKKFGKPESQATKLAKTAAVQVLAKSEAAILVRHPDEKHKVWIPFSQIESRSEINEYSEKDEEGSLIIPAWLAQKKELVWEDEDESPGLNSGEY